MSGNEATNISYTENVAVIAQIVKCDRASAHLSPTSAYAAQLSWLTTPGHVRHGIVYGDQLGILDGRLGVHLLLDTV